MYGERGTLCKALTTRETLERFIAGVRAQVDLDGVLIRKTPAAHGTREVFDALVNDHHVLLDHVQATEPLVAQVALVWLFARMRLIMFQESVLEPLPTRVRTLVALEALGFAVLGEKTLTKVQCVDVERVVGLHMSNHFQTIGEGFVAQVAMISGVVYHQPFSSFWYAIHNTVMFVVLNPMPASAAQPVAAVHIYVPGHRILVQEHFVTGVAHVPFVAFEVPAPGFRLICGSPKQHGVLVVTRRRRSIAMASSRSLVNVVPVLDHQVLADCTLGDVYAVTQVARVTTDIRANVVALDSVLV